MNTSNSTKPLAKKVIKTKKFENFDLTIDNITFDGDEKKPFAFNVYWCISKEGKSMTCHSLVKFTDMFDLDWWWEAEPETNEAAELKTISSLLLKKFKLTVSNTQVHIRLECTPLPKSRLDAFWRISNGVGRFYKTALK